MKRRTVVEVIDGHATQDGSGVKLLRIFGGQGLERFDPFLMLDDFGSSTPDDYIRGFPRHPHRGMITVSYMLSGSFEHRDHLGHVETIHAGGVQWMTAGRGIIHSEMPLQTEGLVRGFQLWINLPSHQKMMSPSYQNVQSDELHHACVKHLKITAIAGSAVINGEDLSAHTYVPVSEPLYWHITNMASQSRLVSVALTDGHTALVYVVAGQAAGATAGQLMRYSAEGRLEFELAEGAQVLLLAGRPLREPIVQYGPFVMNSQAQIEQAIEDYQTGEFVANMSQS
ncbi:pirin family protein [Echinimonas agarilytica]|uniref:Pirin family protein n=1 Tax=Echinimonas agarilytica TaxID=1215918 RepID=A0AA41W3R9_9GAMM|nr:pirin family protein [Echinimonas agarilytica]MCM2678267.1 pirin family protein [Echinimonas agarilytica]